MGCGRRRLTAQLIPLNGGAVDADKGEGDGGLPVLGRLEDQVVERLPNFRILAVEGIREICEGHNWVQKQVSIDVGVRGAGFQSTARGGTYGRSWRGAPSSPSTFPEPRGPRRRIRGSRGHPRATAQRSWARGGSRTSYSNRPWLVWGWWLVVVWSKRKDSGPASGGTRRRCRRGGLLGRVARLAYELGDSTDPLHYSVFHTCHPRRLDTYHFMG